MNKRYYTFVILIVILLALIYAIISHKYKEYKISEVIQSINELNISIKNDIENTLETIEYKKSKAYKNKILKSDKWLKNKSEKVVYITTEDKYNKYIQPVKTPEIKTQIEEKIFDDTYWMSVYQKWIWFIFKEDLR